MKFGVVIRTALLVCVGTAAAYWLFSDTIRHYAPTDEATPLRVSFWGPYEEFEMWNEMLAAFQRKHPEIEVKGEYIPSRYEPKIQQLFVASNAPDVILYQDEPFPNIVKSEMFEDLTPFVERDRAELELPPEAPVVEALKRRFWPTAVESFCYDPNGRRDCDRRVYGLPVWGGCNLLYYNKQCFARCGVRVERLGDPNGSPGLTEDGRGGWVLDDERWTLDEFLKLCTILTRDFNGDGRIDQFGYSLGYWGYWQPVQMTMGAMNLDANLSRTTFYGPAVEKCLGLWQDMLFKHHVSPTPAELGQMGQGVGFYTGRVAIFNSGPWEMPFCNATGVDYDVLHFPRAEPGGRRATRITWDSVTMFRGSRKKELAWLLIKHLTSLESQKIVAKVQRSIPALRAAQEAFVSHNPRVQVRKFVRVAREYGTMQRVTEYWGPMAEAWGAAMTELHNTEPRDRPDPAQAIGMYLSDPRLMKLFPPADPEEAERYRRIYREWRDRRK